MGKMTFRPVCRYKSGTDEQERNGGTVHRIDEDEHRVIEYRKRGGGKYMDTRERKEMFERKERCAQRRNAENMKVETLTEEQHLMLASLAALRHKFHCDYDALWNDEHPDNREMWNALSPDSEKNISSSLENVGLPKLKLWFTPTVPTVEDWFYNLSDEEKEEWEEKAEAFNEENPNAAFVHDGYSLWLEEGEEHEEFFEICENQNKEIEKYLEEIDKEHGTQYAPTGYSRFAG